MTTTHIKDPKTDPSSENYPHASMEFAGEFAGTEAGLGRSTGSDPGNDLAEEVPRDSNIP